MYENSMLLTLWFQKCVGAVEKVTIPTCQEESYNTLYQHFPLLLKEGWPQYLIIKVLQRIVAARVVDLLI
jgi:hypothetical protein